MSIVQTGTFFTILGALSLLGAAPVARAGSSADTAVGGLNGAAPEAADAGPVESGNRHPLNLHGVVTEDDLKGLPTARLVSLLGDELPWTRRAAAQLLAGKGSDSVHLLLDLLGEEDWRVVRAAQDGLVDALRRVENDSEAESAVRRAVVAALPALKQNLRHEHFFVREGALQCLGALGEDAAAAGEQICAMTADEDFRGVGPTALRTIRAIGVAHFDPGHLFAALETSVKSPYINIRKAAIDLIQTLDEARQRKLIPAMLNALEIPMLDGFTRYHVQAQIARLLHKLEAEGTLPRIIGVLEERGWGDAHRVSQLMPLLARYGPEAAEHLPFLEEFHERIKERRELAAQTREAIEAIRGNARNGGGAQ